MTNKVRFKANVEGKDIELCVTRPSQKVADAGQKIYSKVFGECVADGILLKAQMDKMVGGRDEDDGEVAELAKRIAQNELIVQGKVEGKTLKDGFEAAVAMRVDRAALQELLYSQMQYESYTAEGLAEARRFDHLVAHSTFYDDSGKPYFAGVDDLKTRPSDDPVPKLAAQKLAELLYYDEAAEAKRAENVFLAKHGFVDEKMRLVKEVNGEKRLCDPAGRLISPDGFFIDADGRRVNRDGKLVDDDGRELGEVFEFVDDGWSY